MQNPLINNNPFLDDEFEVQSIDGTGNNLKNPEYGTPETPLINIAALAYSDGFSTPNGQNRPNPRTISNAISLQEGDILDPNKLTDFIWAWGQFLDHDLSLTPDSDRPINIQVPTGDPFLDPEGSGNVVIGVNDSEFIEGTGTDPSNPRQLPNELTAFIDGSNIY
ncbi:MAG: peroxidase family protein, partial [Cyanobacteria bacterium J06641_2]